MIRPALLSTSALRSTILFYVALSATTPALAQDAKEAAPAAQDDATLISGDIATVEQPAEAGKEIIVTGSRIRRTEYNSPDPITIIDPAIAQKMGQFDTADMIQSSTIAAGSVQITSAISNAFVTEGGEGAQTVSLRGLGASRTLVLLNGRRAGPAGTRGAVSAFDLNVLPQSIIQSVEILKTGASSVYGSDAVAGVVNLITKRDTQGLELDGFSSVPLQSGGEQYNLSAAWGKDFGRGHILLAADYYKRNELKNGDRKYLNCSEAYIFRPNSRERADLIDPRTGKKRCEDVLWGQIWLYDYQYDYADSSNLVAPNGRAIPYLQYSYPGDNLGQYIPGLAPPTTPFGASVPPGWYPVGYDAASTAVLNEWHPFVNGASFIPKTERWTAYLQGSYELTDHVELYTELLHNRRQTYSNAYRQVWQTFAFSGEFPFPGSGFGDPFAQGFTGAFLTSPTAITDWFDSSTDVKYTRGLVGARGDFGDLFKGWSWDGYLQNSRSKGEYMRQVILDDAVQSATLRTGSCVGTITPISGRPCVDIPWTDPYFLAGQWTDEQKAFLEDTDVGHTKYTQWAGELSANGPLFALPAGQVKAAIGLAWRRDQLTDTPGPITLAGNLWNSTGSGITSGRSVTKEAFGELEVPIIHDTPVIQEFILSAAGRVTNVTTTRLTTGEKDSDNGNWTYRLGANWKVNDWVRFRASYGTSFRSPAIFEQVLENQTGFQGQRDVDPCIRWGAKLANGSLSQQVADACAAQGVPDDHTGGGNGATIFSGGGLGHLKAETSTAKTASVILTPRLAFLPDTKISVAVDWFDIKVKDEVTLLRGIDIVLGCLQSDFFPNDPLCSLFNRVPEGEPSEFNVENIQDDYLNISKQRNTGIDVTANIRQDLGSLGSITLLAQMTWQTKDDVALFPGTNISNNGEDGEPKWVGDFRLSWNTNDRWTFFYGLDVIGATSDVKDYIKANGSLCDVSVTHGPYCVDLTAPARFYHNASITKELDKFEFTIGVSNLFDTKPPRVSNANFNGAEATVIGHGIFSSQYDYVGRRVFANVKARF